MNIDGRNLVDELNELGKLRTAIMMEKCSRKDEVVVCPIPRKQTTFRSVIFLLLWQLIYTNYI